MRAVRRCAPALLALAAGCVAPGKPPPRVAAAPAAPPPPVAIPPAPARQDWRDVPLTPGTWRYAAIEGATVASYGSADAPVFMMRCVAATREVVLSRAGAAGPLTVRTSYGTRVFAPRPGEAGVTLPARDPALDQIAFSRGRFSVASAGSPTLYLPAWAEPSRVIEDCR